MPCDGSCCVAFPVSSTPDELVGMGDHPIDIHHPGNALEAFTIAGMIEPLGLPEVRERASRFGLDKDPNEETRYYKCRHWDEANRLCTIYDERPWMCRTYPNEGVCEHGCDCAGTAICGTSLAA